MERVLLTANGVNGQIELLDDRVRIRRRGTLSVLTHGFKGDKEILVSQISAIQFRQASILLNGFIQFAFIGGSEAKGALFQATRDENSVMFNVGQRARFEDMRRAIEEKVRARDAARSAAPVSDLDELDKLASLRDRGIITEDEFQAKKKQLLGL